VAYRDLGLVGEVRHCILATGVLRNIGEGRPDNMSHASGLGGVDESLTLLKL